MSDVNKSQQSLGTPLNVPPKPSVKNQDEFDRLSPEQQAAMLHAWQGFWLKPAPAVDVRSGSGIVIPESPAHVDTENWKQPPTAEEKQSISDEIWKKF